jgi:hypothetical protein
MEVNSVHGVFYFENRYAVLQGHTLRWFRSPAAFKAREKPLGHLYLGGCKVVSGQLTVDTTHAVCRWPRRSFSVVRTEHVLVLSVWAAVLLTLRMCARHRDTALL